MNHIASQHQVVGCIHIHSRYSDGTGTIPEISNIAKESGLDFIMITDHNHLRGLIKGEEGWYGNVLTIIGYEINDIDDTNHYLAFGLPEEVNKHLPAPQYVRQVRLNGGFGIIAHPDEKRHVFPEHPAYPWTAWESDDFQGIEIWNQMSEWMEGLTPWNKLWRFVNPRKSIIAPVPKTLDRWDSISQKRKVVGIGGVDAHAHKHKMLGGLIQVTVFRYKVQFKTVRTHLLLNKPLTAGMDKAEAKNLIYDALLECRVFISNYFNGDARGFQSYASNTLGQASIGGSLQYSPDTRLHAAVPSPAEIHLIKNGKMVETRDAQTLDFKIDGPGIYRLEIFRKKRAWIFSNHIRIVD